MYYRWGFSKMKNAGKPILLTALFALYTYLGVTAISEFPSKAELRLVHRTERLTPPFKELLQGSMMEPAQLARYIKYYNHLLKHYPQETTIKEMLGFCYSKAGRKDLSVPYYQESIAANPQFFWNHYNLGILHLYNDDLAWAQSSFEMALKSSFEESIKHLFSSRPYLQIIAASQTTPDVLIESLKKGYERALEYVKILKTYDTLSVEQKKELLQKLQENSRLAIF
jgi:tetratricopeptide (TPR) repeat protein